MTCSAGQPLISASTSAVAEASHNPFLSTLLAPLVKVIEHGIVESFMQPPGRPSGAEGARAHPASAFADGMRQAPSRRCASTSPIRSDASTATRTRKPAGMRIVDVTVFKVDASWRNWVFLRVETDSDLVGYGECTVEGREHAVEGAVKDMARRLRRPGPAPDPRPRRPADAPWLLGQRARSSARPSAGSRWRCGTSSVRAWRCPCTPCSAAASATRRVVYSNAWYFGAQTADDFARASGADGRRRATARSSSTRSARPGLTISESELTDWRSHALAAVREAVGPEVGLLIEGHGRFGTAQRRPRRPRTRAVRPALLRGAGAGRRHRARCAARRRRCACRSPRGSVATARASAHSLIESGGDRGPPAGRDPRRRHRAAALNRLGCRRRVRLLRAAQRVGPDRDGGDAAGRGGRSDAASCRRCSLRSMRRGRTRRRPADRGRRRARRDPAGPGLGVELDDRRMRAPPIRRARPEAARGRVDPRPLGAPRGRATADLLE